MALNQDIVEAVANSNFKTMAEANQLVMAGTAQNAAAHQNRLNLIAESSVGQIVKNLNEFDTEQAQSIRTVINTELAPLLSSLIAAVSSGQQHAKVAQTTPPVT